jgi:L-asparaginase/Glu-tRNA(Gln) amidotransferase subunit D
MTRRFLRWFFQNRETGAITIAQAPNLSLWIVIVAGALIWAWHPPDRLCFAAAMRPSTALSADGPLNLYNAIILAGSKQAVGKGVLVSMDDNIFTARDIAKTNTFKTDTFRSPYGPLGYVVEGKVFFIVCQQDHIQSKVNLILQRSTACQR